MNALLMRQLQHVPVRSLRTSRPAFGGHLRNQSSRPAAQTWSARLIGWSGGPIQHDWCCESQPDEAILSPLYDRRYEYPTLKSDVNVRSGSKSGRTVSHGAAF